MRVLESDNSKSIQRAALGSFVAKAIGERVFKVKRIVDESVVAF